MKYKKKNKIPMTPKPYARYVFNNFFVYTGNIKDDIVSVDFIELLILKLKPDGSPEYIHDIIRHLRGFFKNNNGKYMRHSVNHDAYKKSPFGDLTLTDYVKEKNELSTIKQKKLGKEALSRERVYGYGGFSYNKTAFEKANLC